MSLKHSVATLRDTKTDHSVGSDCQVDGGWGEGVDSQWLIVIPPSTLHGLVLIRKGGYKGPNGHGWLSEIPGLPFSVCIGLVVLFIVRIRLVV